MAEMKLLTREQIKDADDIVTERVLVPEWLGEVIVRTLSGTERDAFEAMILIDDETVNRENVRAKLVALTCVGEDGEPLFTEIDVGWLGKKSSRALDRVFSVAQRLAGLRKEDIKDLVGNSEGDQSEDSTSG